MKKVITLALVAAAFVGCAKSEADFKDAQQISFMPVSRFDTRAAVTGETYSENYPFYVYANAKSEGQATFNSKFFEKVSFVPDGANKSGSLQVYKGSPAQYWPNVNPLVFAGFTQTGNVASITPSANDVLTSLTLDGYTQPAPTEEVANDFMYFFADNNGVGYDKNTTCVDPTMKHACSWVTININADEELVEDRDDQTSGVQAYWANLQVTEVKFVNLFSTGDVTLTGSASSWNFTKYAEAPVIVKASTEAAMPITTDSEEFADILNNTIVLPQQPAYLSVTYTYTTPAGVDGFTETKVLPLCYDGEVRADGQTDAQWRESWKAWEPGKHYIYNLTLTAKEIKIAPSSSNWVTDLDGNDADDDNIEKPF